MCNDAEIGYDGEKYTRVGEPTEAALKILVEKMGLPDAPPPASAAEAASHFCELRAAEWERLATLEFSRSRKSMSVLCKNRLSGKNSLFVKGGAPRRPEKGVGASGWREWWARVVGGPSVEPSRAAATHAAPRPCCSTESGRHSRCSPPLLQRLRAVATHAAPRPYCSTRERAAALRRAQDRRGARCPHDGRTARRAPPPL